MALDDLLSLSEKTKFKKVGISQERINAVKPVLRQYIAYWRWYPDMFVDQVKGKHSKFKFYYYQRIFLRVLFRHRIVYCVFPRAYSKSFLTFFASFLRCILYPGAKIFVSAEGKEQSAQLLSEKITEIIELIPPFKYEVKMGRGSGTIMTKDYVKILFRNGSVLDNLVAGEKSRGKRRHAGILEECASMDGKVLSEILIPIMNINRPCADGEGHEEEPLNQSQIYITTAGYKNSFAYNKLIQALVWSAIEPENAMILGGSWRIPVISGLQSYNIIKNIKSDDTYDEQSFNREYESIWTGTVDGAFFNGEAFNKNRTIKAPEYERPKKMVKDSFYVFSVDVGRKSDNSVITIIKVIPLPNGSAVKQVVNIENMYNAHFLDQGIMIRRLYDKFLPKRIVIDANGLGVGLVDILVKEQTDEKTGEVYPPLGVYNDKDGDYKRFVTEDTIPDVLYILKANVALNSEMHNLLQVQLNTNKIKFLQDDRAARLSLQSSAEGKRMSPPEREEYLRPFVLTSILKTELLNLREDNENNVNTILKKVNTSLKKDKVSSLEMGIYYIKTEEEDKKNRRKRDFSKYLFMN